MTVAIPTTTFSKVTYPNRVPTTTFKTVTYPNRPKPTTTKPAKTTPTYSGTTVAAPAASTAPQPDPLDATYFQNVGANQATTANKIAGYQKQQTDAFNALPTFNYKDVAYGPQGPTGPGAPLAHQYGVDVLAQQIAAARRGGLFSSSLGQRIGDVGQTYQDKYTTAQSNYQKLADQIATQITGAQDAQNQYEIEQRGAATERASTAAQNNPALGMPTTPLVNDQYLIQGGHAAPNYALTPPKSAPKGAKWSGNVKPPGNWRGIGGGWWVPK
jgi:hypothetical protein